MTVAPEPTPPSEQLAEGLTQEKDERKRRALLLVLMLLLLLLCCVGYFFLRYLAKPQPVVDMLPVVNQVVYYPPTFKQAITGVDKPIGVAVSPDGQRIYVTESSGERLIKIFGQDGKLIKSFSPPGTVTASRKPTYIAVDASGRVFVSEIYNGVIDVFDGDGKFIDAIIDQDMTLSKYVGAQTKSPLAADFTYYYDINKHIVVYQPTGRATQSFPAPERKEWAPMGVRFTKAGDLLVTNLVGGKHEVVIFPAASLQALDKFSPQVKTFGVEGKDNGQLSFPNSAVVDSKGNFYVSDGNNARVSAWTADLKYRTFFGFGSADSALNLPRGMWMDDKDHLLVVDAVGATVRAYDVSNAEPAFLYSFGVIGTGNGEMNYPNDIFMDGSGSVYITDRENNRITIWSY